MDEEKKQEKSARTKIVHVEEQRCSYVDAPYTAYLYTSAEVDVLYEVRVCVVCVCIFTFGALISRCKYRKVNEEWDNGREKQERGNEGEQSVRFALDFNSDTYGC